MNNYERKQAQRKECYEDKSTELADQSQQAHARAREMASLIPFGQPVLVGHHSERGDRNYRDKIHNTFGKAFRLQEKAAHYADKAAAVGTGGISGDDPDAIEKLRAELAEVEQHQERMKQVNKAIRSHKSIESRATALVALGFGEAAAAELVKPDVCGRIGYASYQLSNNNANRARIERRIRELTALRERAQVEVERDGYTYREDTEENRVMFIFDGKPDEATRAVLKSNAFKWSPSRGAWVRQLTAAGIYAGKQVRRELAALAQG